MTTRDPFLEPTVFYSNVTTWHEHGEPELRVVVSRANRASRDKYGARATHWIAFEIPDVPYHSHQCTVAGIYATCPSNEIPSRRALDAYAHNVRDLLMLKLRSSK